MKISDILPYVVNDLPGCPAIIATQGVLLAARELCQRTLCWDEFQDPVALVNKVSSYDLEAPSGASAYTIRDVFCGNAKLRAISMNELQDLLPNWRTATGNMPVFYTRATDRAQVTVYPTPDQVISGTKLVFRVTYVPILSATTVPDFLGTDYLDAITAGAKARLMLSPGATYANPSLAPVHRAVFEDAITQAIAETLHERAQGTVTVRPRAFI